MFVTLLAASAQARDPLGDPAMGPIPPEELSAAPFAQQQDSDCMVADGTTPNAPRDGWKKVKYRGLRRSQPSTEMLQV